MTFRFVALLLAVMIGGAVFVSLFIGNPKPRAPLVALDPSQWKCTSTYTKAKRMYYMPHDKPIPTIVEEQTCVQYTRIEP